MTYRPRSNMVHPRTTSLAPFSRRSAGIAALAIGEFSSTHLQEFFGSVERVGTLDNGLDVENEEQGHGIWVCREPVASLPKMWRDLRHYG
jgi:hypothetical protein